MMQKFYYDLHIHTTLSPCGDIDMTPNNIVNMSYIKALDFIAVTDHNCIKHVEQIKNLAAKQNIMVIPGIEVETIEEVHLLCLFSQMDELNRFGNAVYNHLPDIPNDHEFFGKQSIYDESDQLIGEEHKLLCNSTTYKLEDIVNYVHLENGIVFAAHVDKRANSIISNLGFIPENLHIDGIEISNHSDPDEFFKKYSQYSHYKYLQNSDAHYLKDISERIHYVELPDLTPESFIEYFRRREI